MRLRMAILLLLPLFLMGCANTIILHPIQKSDIFQVPQGTVINGTPTEKPGWFLSDVYLKEVGKAKVK